MNVDYMQWADDGYDDYRGVANKAEDIVQWIKANRGEAQYVPDAIQENKDAGYRSIGPLIAVRASEGWNYAKFSDYIVMGDEFILTRLGAKGNLIRREFVVATPEEFEQDNYVGWHRKSSYPDYYVEGKWDMCTGFRPYS